MKVKKEKISFIYLAKRSIPVVFKTVPWHFTFDISLSILTSLALSLNIVVTMILFDAITDAAMGEIGFWDTIPAMLLFVALVVGEQILRVMYQVNWRVWGEKATGRIKTLIYQKMQRIDPAQFEETVFLDDVNKAKGAVNAISYFTIGIIVIISDYGVYLTAVGVFLFRLQPMLLITIMIAFFPALLAQIVKGKIFTRLEQESAPIRREFDYYKKTLNDREYFKETRILGIFNFLHKLFTDSLQLLTNKTRKAERNTALLELLLNVTTFLGMGASAYLLFTATMSGEISVGAFAAVFSTLSLIFGRMQRIVADHYGGIQREIGKVNNFFRLLDMPERTGADGIIDFTHGIEAEKISFTYPGRNTPAVKEISLVIKDGETIAIVGENGTGKSTLVRLLTGIYRPSEGTVKVGGLDTADVSPISIFQGISGVFQKYQRYKMTLEENVVISDVSSPICENNIANALQKADADMSGEMSMDTMLSPEFDGIDLSGGQWQRLAIARGLYRSNGFIVLDEPTSAIDPIEETRIYTQFQQLAKGKCAVVVTHRLGSAKLAHRIIVMDAGQIVDIGTHDELLSKPGKYADMWVAQAQWYERTNGIKTSQI